MKTIDRVKSTFLSIRKSIKRFPLTIIISTLLAIMLIYWNEASIDGSKTDLLIKVNLLLGLGVFLSLIIGLMLEKYKKSIGATIVSYGGGALALGAYYFFFLNDLNILNDVLATRYVATILAMFLLVLFIQKIDEDLGYEYYVMHIFSEIALTIIYSIVLYIGFSVILFTINNLFEAELPGELYFYALLIVVFVFAVSLFLSKFPRKDEEYICEYGNALKVLLTYIVIPLISIYTIILYLYFGKILITREWPQGLVSHLVLWYSALSVGVLFLTNPIVDKDKISSLFKKIFPKAILPLLLMMFLSIGKRVSQYGFTENRYFVMILGIWVLGMILYYGFKRENKNTILPISLSVLFLLSVYGPISSFSISKLSQNNRLEDILEKNDMISDGDIVASSEISSEEKKEINNIISYFESNHKIEDIKLLPDDFKTKDMPELMGFKYESYNRYGYNEDEYVFYGLDRLDKPIDITGYEYYIELNTWSIQSIQVSDFKLKYDRETSILDVILDDGEKLKYDIGQYAQSVYDTQSQISDGIDAKEQDMDIKDMTFDMNVDNEYRYIDMKLIFTNINGQVYSENILNLENCEFIILVNISDKLE